MSLQKSVLKSSMASFINRDSNPTSLMTSQISAFMGGKSQTDLTQKFMKDVSFSVTHDTKFLFVLSKICYKKSLIDKKREHYLRQAFDFCKDYIISCSILKTGNQDKAKSLMMKILEEVPGI